MSRWKTSDEFSANQMTDCGSRMTLQSKLRPIEFLTECHSKNVLLNSQIEIQKLAQCLNWNFHLNQFLMSDSFAFA